jgi:PTS system mannose-specific IIA component
MVNLLVITHGEFADGLVDAMQLIIGPQEGIQTLSLKETDAIDLLGERVQTAVNELDMGEGVLVLVDLLGASPFNISARLSMENKNVEVVTGVNLPMLLETAMQRQEMSLREVAAVAKEAGTSGIVIVSEKMQSNE